jgi:hypothetical protein
VQVALYEKHLRFGVLVIRHTYDFALSTSFNDGIRDAPHQALVALCEEIHKDRSDKQVRRITEKYTVGTHKTLISYANMSSKCMK